MWRILSPTSISTPISPIFQICLCLLQHHCPLSSSYCSDITWLAIMTNIDAQYHQGDHLQWQYIHILQPLPSNSWMCSTITPSPRTKSITAILDTSLIVYSYLTLSSWLSNAATPSAHAVPVDCLTVHHCYTQWWCHHVPYYHSLATARSCSSIHSIPLHNKCAFDSPPHIFTIPALPAEARDTIRLSWCATYIYGKTPVKYRQNPTKNSHGIPQSTPKPCPNTLPTATPAKHISWRYSYHLSEFRARP